MIVKRKKCIIIAYIVYLVGVTTLFCCSSFLDHFISYKNECYSFLRELSRCDTDWAIGNYLYLDADLKTKELRSEIRKANNDFGFFRSTLTSHIVAIDENGDYENFSCYMNDISLEKTRLITLSDFCDGNTSDEGKLYTIPLQVMFVDSTCDITKYSDPSTSGSSYIPIDMANAIIANDEDINDYESLLGKKYCLNDKYFTINNIFYSNTYLAPFLLKYYGKFIIIDSSSFLDDYRLSITSSYKADSITQDDYLSYFKKQRVAVNSFTYLKDDQWQSDYHTTFMKNEILSKQSNSLYMSPFFWCYLLINVFNGFLVVSMIKRKMLSLNLFKLIFSCSIIVLLMSTISNLFLYNKIVFLSIFNNYLTVFLLINCLLMLLIPILIPRFKSKVYTNQFYEINI